MEISGYVLKILDDRIVVELSRNQKVDVFLTPNRKILLQEHIIVERSAVKFFISLQNVEVKGENLAKLWLNYIIFPTSTVVRQSKRSKGDGRGNWAEGRLK